MSARNDPPASHPRSESELWTRPRAVIAVVAVLVAIKLVVAASTDLIRDEAYYVLWSLYPLQAGYYDHPPGVVWLVKAGFGLAGGSELAARLLPVLATIACAAAVYRTASILFDDRRIAAYATLWFSLSLGTVIELFLTTPDAPSTLFWTLAIWTAAELHRSRKANWWLLFGLFAGLGLASKYTGFFLGGGILVWLVAYRENRRWFRTWQLYAGGVIALGAFAPVVAWNMAHDFMSLDFQMSRTTAAMPGLQQASRYVPDFLFLQAVLLGPLVFAYLLAGVAFFLKRPGNRRDPAAGLLVTAVAPALLYFAYHALHSRVQANWTLPLFGQFAILAAWAAVAWLPAAKAARRALSFVRQAVALLSAVLALLLYAEAAFGFMDLSLDIQIDEMAGWQQVAAEVAEIAQQADTQTVLGDDYGMTGWLASYGRFARHDLDVLPGRELQRYGFMPLPDYSTLEQPFLFVMRVEVGRDAPTVCSAAGEPVQPYAVITRNGPGGRPADRIHVFALDDLPAACAN